MTIARSVARSIASPITGPSSGEADLVPPEGASVWFRADAETYANGANVTQWSDQSGNGRHVTASSSWPTFATNVNGSRPGINFNGSQALTRTAYTGSGTGYVMAMIGSLADTAFRIAIGRSGVHYFGALNNRAPIFWRGAEVKAPNFSWVDYLPVSVWVNGTEAKLYIGKGLYASASVSSGAFGFDSVGALDGSFNWSGNLTDFIAYESALSDADLEQLHDYLLWQAGKPDAVNIVALGDSLTGGYGPDAGPPRVYIPYTDKLATDLGASYNVINQGIDSHTLGDHSGASGYLLSHVATDVYNRVGKRQSANPDICVLWIGTNDLYYGATTAELIADLETVCAGIKAAGYYLILINMIDRVEDSNWTRAKQTTINNYLAANIGTLGDALINAAAQYPDAADSSKFFDQVHLSNYDWIADAVKAAILAR